jgi:hypothetical protein
MKSTEPGYADIQALAKRMALIIAEARFGDDSVKAGAELKKKIEALKIEKWQEKFLASFMRDLQRDADRLPPLPQS